MNPCSPDILYSRGSRLGCLFFKRVLEVELCEHLLAPLLICYHLASQVRQPFE
jgi:hypothetical protein